jgi:hypothetical protein
MWNFVVPDIAKVAKSALILVESKIGTRLPEVGTWSSPYPVVCANKNHHNGKAHRRQIKLKSL